MNKGNNTIEKKISYSEFKTWKECPYKHNLSYVQGLSSFRGNLYSAFGTAIHEVCESILLKKKNNLELVFNNSFQREILLSEEKGVKIDPKLKAELTAQSAPIYSNLEETLNNKFGNYEVFSVEEPLYEKIEEFNAYDRSFKGFIDAVIKSEDGYYYIIDWKTCSWGWSSQKKSDPIVNYQLTFYKNFFCKKNKIDPKKVKTMFVLLKRTAKKEQIEFVEVTSGTKKVNNSLKLLEKAVINIENNVKIKNRLSCKYCDFYKTENCK
tara:strand:+ start:41 stop:838 length:798 start_codon:yes stop_codon:yes gene_type:complete